MSKTTTINSAYSLSALLIHSTKQEVTKEKMQAIFSKLGLEFSPKLASLFTLTADKYSAMISNLGSSSAPVAVSAAATTKKVEEVAEKEQSSDADLDMDF
jgi:ribosomal protein L12E/L44/L45/RPP1/RPP2